MLDISLFEQPLGENREKLSGPLESVWQSDAACEMQKTGYGLTRRAYFLETCTYTNLSGASLCSRAIELARYRYFEDFLVQVVFEFDGLPSEEYQMCISAKATENHYSKGPNTEGWLSKDKSLSIWLGSVDETVVSNAIEVAKIHRLRAQ